MGIPDFAKGSYYANVRTDTFYSANNETKYKNIWPT